MMKNKLISTIAFISAFTLSACTPIKPEVTNQYKIASFSKKKMATKKSSCSLLISQPDATAGYQTEQMIYTDKPYTLSSFAHSAWISSPANMLYPLITQSLQHNHFFFAVASGPDADKTDYRLDTQLISLQQDFLRHPSTLDLAVQTVLTHVPDHRIVASKMFVQCVPCLEDTPYGGVVAANKAALAYTSALSEFVIANVKRDGQCNAS
jgi:cholesterol transport system auxiliary component